MILDKNIDIILFRKPDARYRGLTNTLKSVGLWAQNLSQETQFQKLGFDECVLGNCCWEMLFLRIISWISIIIFNFLKGQSINFKRLSIFRRSSPIHIIVRDNVDFYNFFSTEARNPLIKITSLFLHYLFCLIRYGICKFFLHSYRVTRKGWDYKYYCTEFVHFFLTFPCFLWTFCFPCQIIS